MSEAEQIHAFCSALLGGPDGRGDDRLSGLRAYLWTITGETKRTRWERADDPDTIASASAHLAEGQPHTAQHIYLGTGLLAAADVDEMGRNAPYKRARNDTVSGLFALCVDIDIAGGVHTSKPYPPTVDDARRIWEAVPLAPTVLVHSGNGLQVWWAFAEPWLIEDGDDPAVVRDAMYDLARQWSATLRYHAHRLGGWQIDSTFDLARVMRVPGTLNVRGEHVTRARILEIDPDARHEIDDFRNALADPAEIERHAAGTGMPGGMVKELPGVDLMAVWRRATALKEQGYTPPWLATRLQFEPGSALEGVWEGHKTTSGDSSASGVDASLARLLFNTGKVTPEQVAEAIMCRRLRAGDLTALRKVDPRRRRDYIVTTVLRMQDNAAKAAAKRGDVLRQAEAMHERAAALRVPEPGAVEDDPATIEDVALDVIEHGEYPSPETVLRNATARVKAEHRPDGEPAANGDRPAVPPPPPVSAPPSIRRVQYREPRAIDAAASIWSERHPDAVTAMDSLSNLLFTDPYRKAGLEVFALEFRDYGENQRGRLILRVPTNFAWPGGDPPAMYRPGRPLYCDWYRRPAFDVPKGYRTSLIYDVQIPARPIEGKKEEWQAVIDMCVPYWRRDSSGSDIVVQMHEWLTEFLTGHAATTREEVAADHRRAWLADHGNWGADGPPLLWINQAAFLDFVARQPGGVQGRNARPLLGYLDVTAGRPWISGMDGRKRRSGWLKVSPDQFDREEWARVLEVAQDALLSEERRGLHVVGGEQS